MWVCQRGVSTCAGRAGWIGWGLGGGGWIVISTNANRRFLNSFSFSRVWFFVSSLFSCLRLRSRNLSIRSVRSGAVGWGVGGGRPQQQKTNERRGIQSNYIVVSLLPRRVYSCFVVFWGEGAGPKGAGLGAQHHDSLPDWRCSSSAAAAACSGGGSGSESESVSDWSEWSPYMSASFLKRGPNSERQSKSKSPSSVPAERVQCFVFH